MYCYFGSSSWKSGTHLQIPADPPDLTIHHDGAGYDGHLGEDVTSGDVNGDGIADLIIGELFGQNHLGVGTGTVHVVFGRASFDPPEVFNLIQTPADITIFGAGYADQLGWRVASGDVNGDGIDDIVAGSRWGRSDDFGRVYVIYGSTDFPKDHEINLAADTPDIEIRGREYYSLTGDIVGVADLNGDGFKDICFNAGWIDTIPGRRGMVFVVYGQDFPPGHFIDLETEQADLEILGDAFEVSYLGRDMTGGDMDGDGCEELVLTAFSCAERPQDEGVVYVLPGSRQYPPHLSLDFSVDAPALKILGYQSSGVMTYLSEMRDMNNDGFLDLICSAPNVDREDDPGQYNAGEIYVILSDGNLFDPPAFLASPGFNQANPPELRLYDTFYHETWTGRFTPYLVHGYGLVSAAGDLDGDGYDELITGPGPGPYHPATVLILDRDGERQAAYQAYGTPRYGVLVSSGDLDGDGVDEIITGAGPGEVYGPHVRGWRWDGGSAVSPLPGVSFLAYGTNRWGVNVTCGDIDGDGNDEIITGAGPGAVFGPHVRGWNVDGGTAAPMPGVSFFAYGTLRWGVNVACGDIDGDGIDEIVTGPGPSKIFSAHVRGWDCDGAAVAPIPGVNFIAYPSLPHSMGCTVACGDVDNDRVAEILTGPGPHPANPAWLGTWNYDGKALTLVESKTFLVFEEGDYIAGARIATGNFHQRPDYLP